MQQYSDKKKSQLVSQLEGFVSRFSIIVGKQEKKCIRFFVTSFLHK